MLPILFSQSRRFGLFAFGMAILAVALSMRSGQEWTALFTVVFFLFIAVCALTLGLGILALIPNYRGYMEYFGLSALITTAVLFYLPLTGMVPMIVAGAIFGISLVGIMLFLKSPLAKRMAEDKPFRDSHACYIAFPARRVWRHVVPGECPPSEHCTGILESCNELEDGFEDLESYRLELRGRKGNATYDITYLDKTAPEQCRFYFQGNEADGTIVDGVFALHVTRMDRDSCFVSTTEERNGLSLRAFVERWFDNPLAFHNLRLQAKLLELYSDTMIPAKPKEA